MELQQILEERYSVRNYRPEPVREEDLQQILQAGRLAPTGKNRQPQRIYVLQSPQALEKIRSVCRCIFGAPTVLLVCYNTDEAWHNHFEGERSIGQMDVTIVTSMMMLKAWELGVGSCWVKYYDPKDVIRAFELPENIVPACILDLGYPAENAHPREDMHFGSKTVEEMTVYL